MQVEGPVLGRVAGLQAEELGFLQGLWMGWGWAAGGREGRGRPVGDVRLQRAGWKVQVRRRWAAWGDPDLA